MLNNGAVFAESMRESYDKQKGFVASVKTFDVTPEYWGQVLNGEFILEKTSNSRLKT